MDKYTQVNTNYIRMWLLASMINGIVSCILLTSLKSDVLFMLIFTTGCSLIFSIPILLVAMAVTSLVLSIKKDIPVFGTVLWVTSFVSLAGAMLFGWLFNMIGEAIIPLCISIVASAVVAVIICQKKLEPVDMKEE